MSGPTTEEKQAYIRGFNDGRLDRPADNPFWPGLTPALRRLGDTYLDGYRVGSASMTARRRSPGPVDQSKGEGNDG